MSLNKVHNDRVVSSWEDLCREIYAGSWQESIGRFRSNYAFRGLADRSYRLVSSFRRNCGTHTRLEYHLLRNFRKYAQLSDVTLADSEWQWLTLAQHYGLPTRLLDWTYSPFVAMHFATCETEHYDKDGVIWMVDFVETNRLLPLPLINQLSEAEANVFTVGMLERAVPSLGVFDRMADQVQVMFFEPPSLDARIVNQFALLSVMSDPLAVMEDWLHCHPGLFRRIVIPKELKWEVRDKLDQANISERILFPGLDGLASWLRRHYQPRNVIAKLTGDACLHIIGASEAFPCSEAAPCDSLQTMGRDMDYTNDTLYNKPRSFQSGGST